VEEELLLLDETGAPSPQARDLLERSTLSGSTDAGPRLTPEFFQAQVEIVTSPTADLTEVRRQLRRGRAEVTALADELGCAPVAVAGPVVEAPNGPVTANERFDDIALHYARVARDSLMCSLQVHVELTSRAEGVAVVDRVRPWMPLLLAMSANSPFWSGNDTGYASWRSQMWKLWPSTGPVEVFGDVAAYDATEEQMLASGAVLDVGLLNLDARLSVRYPTVEYRVADVCTDVEDALVVAALARGLTETAARAWHADLEPAPWRIDQLRVAAWRAARFGLADSLLHPVTGSLVPAASAVDALLEHVGEALDDTQDLALVQRGLRRLLENGEGATRQLLVHQMAGLAGVVGDLRQRTRVEKNQ
jgi:carboxylate-amine ligase